MYQACLHCGATFARNDVIEAASVGRRLAFDAARGRLWVVCAQCARWNLSPFDERWEAVEQCERAFRATRVRVSTDNIGLARLRDGTDLVRIGTPLRPEFAAWRYGDQFGRRRLKHAMMIGAGAVGAASALAGLYTLGGGLLLTMPIMHLFVLTGALQAEGGGYPAMTLSDGSYIRAIGHSRLIDMPSAPEQWGIEVGFSELRGPLDSGAHRPLRDPWAKGDKLVGRVAIPGITALPLLRQVLPRVNRAGASGTLIRDGVQLIDDAGGPERFAQWATTQRRAWASRSTYGDTGDLAQIPEAARLAFEMSLHEDSERRALEGELSLLHDAWQREEEIAAIADGLVVPPRVEAALDALKIERDRKR